MKRRFFIALLLGISAWALADSSAVSDERRVVVANLRGTINPATADYLRASIARAESEKAAALVVTLDTPGGLVSSVQTMAQDIGRSQVPVVVYVSPSGASATSAGALLLLSSHLAAMAPGTHMGAAHPVDASGKDIPGAMGEKAVNDTAAFAQGLAELRGRNREASEAIVRKSLSFTEKEAIGTRLAEISAENVEELLYKLDGRAVTLSPVLPATVSGAVSSAPRIATLKTAGARLIAVEMTAGQRLLHFLSDPNVAAILMSLAMLCLYVELSHPGIQLAGIAGVILLVVSFMGFQTLPIRTGGLVLLILGGLAMAAEIFVTTHGILALGGTVSFVLGMLWVVDPTQLSSGVSPAVWVPAGLALGSGTLGIAWIARKVTAQSRAAREAMGGFGPAGLAGYRGIVESVEESGGNRARSGKILVRGELWDFVSEEPLAVGDPVEPVGFAKSEEPGLPGGGASGSFKVRVKKCSK